MNDRNCNSTTGPSVTIKHSEVNLYTILRGNETERRKHAEFTECGPQAPVSNAGTYNSSAGDTFPHNPRSQTNESYFLSYSVPLIGSHLMPSSPF